MLDSIVTCRAYVVHRARALVAMPLLSANGDAGKIIIPCYAGLRPQRQHDLLPFGAVRFYSECAIQNVDDVMRYLVRHGCGDVVIKVLGEQIWVVTNNTATAVHPVHTGCAAFKVEQDRDHGQVVTIDPACAPNEIARCSAHLLLILTVYGFNERVVLKICHWRNQYITWLRGRTRGVCKLFPRRIPCNIRNLHARYE